LEFQEKVDSTQSSSIMQKKMVINKKTYSINLWDTIGQEQFRSLTKIFMKGAKIVIFVYDITRLDTFEQLDFWLESTKEVLGDKPVLGIVGNKSDLYFKEAVKEEDAEEYAKNKGIPFRLCSAKTPKLFCAFLEELVKKYIEKMERKLEQSVVDGLKLDDDEGKPKKKGKCC
jgi:small GTP-binding protein